MGISRGSAGSVLTTFGSGQGAADRIVRVGVGFAVIAVFLQTAAHLTYMLVPDGRAGELNVAAEYNAFSWMSSSTTFAAGFLALVLALLNPSRTRRYIPLAAILALFSLDDAVELHEKIGDGATARLFGLDLSFAYLVWPALFFPLLVLAFLLLWDVSRSSTPQARVLMRIALGFLVLGVAAEVGAAAWYIPGGEIDTWPGALQVVLEENAELTGWILIVTALTVEMCRAALSPADGKARRPAVINRGPRRAGVPPRVPGASR